MDTSNIDTSNIDTSNIDTSKEYRLTPEYKKSTYSNECWINKLSNNKRVIYCITTYFRTGNFTITLDDNEKEKLMKKDSIILNDYHACVEELNYGVDHYEFIKDEEKYNNDEISEIKKLLYCIDEENDINNNYLECEDNVDIDNLENNDWYLDETIYGIDGGIILEEIS
jgi:hypothetical protein